MVNAKKILLSCLTLIYCIEVAANNVESRIIPGFGSHIPALLPVVLHTQGPILEIGCGDSSTTLLHAICAPSQRLLVTAEQNFELMNQFLDLQRIWHQFIHVNTPSDWACVENDRHWSVVFIDCLPTEKYIGNIERLKKNTDIFVIHSDNTLQPQILRSFKYQLVYKRYSPWTIIMSDVIDITQFFKN